MSVQYKAVPKGQPGVVGGGNIKFYAAIVRQEPIRLRKFAEEIAFASTLTTVDVYAVLESFFTRLHIYLEDGRSVYLGDLGRFSPSLSSKGEAKETEVDQHTINKMKINFLPSREMQERLANVKFKKVSTANGSEIVE